MLFLDGDLSMISMEGETCPFLSCQNHNEKAASPEVLFAFEGKPILAAVQRK